MKPGQDTDLGGHARDFPSTAWSSILEGPAGRRKAVEDLARTYWKPVYCFIRARWAKSNEDAKDLTQEFFVWILESDFVARADPRRGRFRAFLKIALEHYLVDESRRTHRLKRGGTREILPLDAEHLPPVPDDAQRPPESILDEAWKQELLTRASELLAEAYRKDGKEVYFSVFRDYLLAKDEELDYKEVATRYKISPSDVGNYLRDARLKMRQIVTALVAQTVDSPDALREEMGSLFGGALP